MNKIDFKGLVLGLLFSYLSLFALIIVSVPINFLILGKPTEGVYQNGEQTLFLLMCIFHYIFSGFFVSKLCKRGKIVNPMIIGLLFTVLAFFPDERLSNWYILTTIAIALPFHYIGAFLHIVRANKFKNEKSASGSDASSTRPL